MAIDLPPVIPPQASTPEKIAEHADASSRITVQAPNSAFVFQITGNRYLAEDKVRQIFTVANDPSQAVRGLNQAYYQSGHLLVTTYYARQGNTIFVHVVNGRVADIKGPRSILNFFDELVGDEDLTAAEFDKQRVLADVKSTRQGVDYRVSYKLEGDPENFTLIFSESEVEGYESNDLSAYLTNQGNRFVGRYFGGASMTQRFSTGTEAVIAYDKAIPEWGETDGGRSYDALRVKLDHVTSAGLFGVQASYVEYERDAEILTLVPGNPGVVIIPGTPPIGATPDTIISSETQLDAEIRTVALNGQQILASSPTHRLILSEKLEYVDSEIRTSDGQTILDEPTASFELGARYTRHMLWWGRSSKLDLQAAIEKGLSSDRGTLGTDDSDGVVSAGARSGDFLTVQPQMAFKLGLSDNYALNTSLGGQWADTQLPQHYQYVFGGLTKMSAWLPGVLVGDSGVHASVSVERAAWDIAGFSITPSVFVEYGQLWYEDASGDAGDKQSLSDGGFRLKASWGDWLESQIVVAAPLSEDVQDEDRVNGVEADFFWHLKTTL